MHIRTANRRLVNLDQHFSGTGFRNGNLPQFETDARNGFHNRIHHFRYHNVSSLEIQYSFVRPCRGSLYLVRRTPQGEGFSLRRSSGKAGMRRSDALHAADFNGPAERILDAAPLDVREGLVGVGADRTDLAVVDLHDLVAPFELADRADDCRGAGAEDFVQLARVIRVRNLLDRDPALGDLVALVPENLDHGLSRDGCCRRVPG